MDERLSCFASLFLACAAKSKSRPNVFGKTAAIQGQTGVSGWNYEADALGGGLTQNLSSRLLRIQKRRSHKNAVAPGHGLHRI